MTAAAAKIILMVDDDEVLRESLSEQLHLHEDFITVEAGTGTEALNLAKREYFDAVDFGATTVAVDNTAVDDLNQEGDEFTSYGAFVVQNFDKIGTEFYLGARNHELDRLGSNFDDIFAVLGGARVKF